MTTSLANPDVLITAREEVAAFEAWLRESLTPLIEPDHVGAFEGWRHELDAIRSLVNDASRVRVALIGTTGAGKSTFLNAVLRQEVLPVGVMHPCTAFVTSVTYAPEQRYTLTIRYATREEWARDVETFASMLEPGETDDDGAGHLESKRMVEVARKRLQGVLGDAIPENPSAADVRNAQVPDAVEALFQGSPVRSFVFNDSKEMLDRLRGLVRGDSPLWPLVREVSISGPYEPLQAGIEIVDLPGLNDPNEARVEVTREYLRTSPFVWLVFPMVRGLTADIRRILHEERILRTLVLNGTYAGLALVGTKADDIDMDSANQLGLPEDCELAELIAAYREQTVSEAREQLEDIVRGLPSSADTADTHQRMLEMARNVRVHTTSASAYNRLAGVGRLRKDYGLDDEDETGIPQVREHLAEIGREAGANFSARTARSRLEQLRQEIDLYFRAKGEATSPRAEEARARFRGQSEDFARDVSNYRARAQQQLDLYRKHFLDRLDPLFRTSVEGVAETTARWHGLYWSTLRAIVQRDGVFRSPSTGKAHDLNSDLSEPFLAGLPVAWEAYFTDDLGRVTDELVVRMQEAGKNFCGKVALTAELLFGQPDSMENQLSWFEQKMSLLADEVERSIHRTITERRSELAAKLPLVAKERMLPAYDAAKDERGSGMKLRILGHLESTAMKAAQPMYATIQGIILEGLGDLDVVIGGLFQRLADEAVAQSRTVVHNANVGLDELQHAPGVTAALARMPRAVA